jgi:hypothetical protein
MKTRYEVLKQTSQQLDMRSWKKSFQASSSETPSAVYTKVYRAAVKIDEYRHLFGCIDVAGL